MTTDTTNDTSLWDNEGSTTAAAETTDADFREAETGREARTAEEVSGEATQEKAEGETQQGTENKEGSQEGEGTTAETPAAEGVQKQEQSEKMIPESQLKAALRNVTKERDDARRELAAKNAPPAPDGTKDPEGRRLYDKMEMSREMAIRQYGEQTYNEAIEHFHEMAKATPSLYDVIAKDTHPAQMAYDLAMKDKELTELEGLKGSDEWKQFQEWKKTGGAAPAQGAQQSGSSAAQTAAGLSGQRQATDAASKVPNLTRTAPNVNRDLGKTSSEEELFGDHYSVKFG